ncbi:MAG: hypothetical protein ACU837_06920 [Gammaproteobacteria bacterium]
MKTITKQTKILAGIIAATVSAALLSACDSGGGSKSASAVIGAPVESVADNTLQKDKSISGKVLNKQGPAMGGTLKISDKNGKEVATATINHDDGAYQAVVPKGTVYPIVLTATPAMTSGIDLKVIKGYIADTSVGMSDVTPITTKVVEAAIQMGGLTKENIITASRVGLMSITGSGGGGGGGGHGGH